jgi:hypothetical protein
MAQLSAAFIDIDLLPYITGKLVMPEDTTG